MEMAPAVVPVTSGYSLHTATKAHRSMQEYVGDGYTTGNQSATTSSSRHNGSFKVLE